MRQLPNLPLELLQKQTTLDLSNPAKREEFRQFVLQTIDLAVLVDAREKVPELAHWSNEEIITFGQLYSEKIYEISSFQDVSRDGWLDMLALSDTLSYPIEKCLEAFYGYGIFQIDELNGVYKAWLVDNDEAKKRINFNLEFADPNGCLADLMKKVAQL